jgi:adhesin transport system outer membrane protein
MAIYAKTKGDFSRKKIVHCSNLDVLSLTKGKISKIKIAFLGLIVGPTLAACGALPIELKQADNRINASLSEIITSDKFLSRPTVAISEGFESAVQKSVLENNAYIAAVSLEEEMLTGIDVAKSFRRVQVVGNSLFGVTREQGSTGGASTSLGMTAGLNLTQVVYDGGESTTRVDTATFAAIGSSVEREIAGNELALDSGLAWVDFWHFRERLNLLDQRIAEMAEVVSQVERMASNGMIDRATLDNVRRKVVEFQIEQTKLEAEFRSSQVRFAKFFNQSPDKIMMPSNIAGSEAIEKLATEWRQSPIMTRGAIEVLIAKNEVLAAEAALKPKVVVKSALNIPMDDVDDADASVGFAVEYIFGDGGRRASALKIAKSRVTTREAKLIDTHRSLIVELDAAIHSLSGIETSDDLLKKKIAFSASEIETARSQLSTGQANLRQLIDAKIEHYRAEDSKISLNSEKLALRLTILSRLGELGKAVGLPSYNKL